MGTSPVTKLVIFGARETAEVIDHYFRTDSDHEVVAFTVDGEHMDTDRFSGRPVIAFEDLAGTHPPEEADVFVAISYGRMNRDRARAFEAVRTAGYATPSFISSKAMVADTARIGENVFVMEGNSVQPFVSIGDDTLLWSANHLGHHSVIGQHCYFASHVVLSGQCEVGDFSFLGVNVTVRDRVRIGAASLIGAGALILSDTAEKSVYAVPESEPRRITSDRVRSI